MGYLETGSSYFSHFRLVRLTNFLVVEKCFPRMLPWNQRRMDLNIGYPMVSSNKFRSSSYPFPTKMFICCFFFLLGFSDTFFCPNELAEVAGLHDGCAGRWPCISQGAAQDMDGTRWAVMSQKS